MQNASKEHLFGNSRAGKRLKKEVNRNCLNAVWNIKQYHYVAILSVLCKDTCLKLKSGFDQCVVKKLQTFFFCVLQHGFLQTFFMSNAVSYHIFNLTF